MRTRLVLSMVLLFGLTASGCRDDSGDASVPPVPVADPVEMDAEGSPASAAGTPATEPWVKTFSGLKATVPAGWIEISPKNPDFIQAEFQLPGESGDGRLTASTAGGGVDANIDRWIGQFQRAADDEEPRRETLSVDGREITLVDVRGTFNAGPMSGGGPQDDQRLLGAVLPLGQRLFFFKLTGPANTIAEHQEEFRKFLNSVEFDD